LGRRPVWRGAPPRRRGERNRLHGAGAGGDSHRSVGHHGEPQLEVERLDAARPHAAEQQRAQIHRHFRARRRENHAAVQFDGESIDGERRAVVGVGDGRAVEREFIAPAELVVERLDQLRREPIEGDRPARQSEEEGPDRDACG
jgi:hypothetical protein